MKPWTCPTSYLEYVEMLALIKLISTKAKQKFKQATHDYYNIRGPSRLHIIYTSNNIMDDLIQITTSSQEIKEAHAAKKRFGAKKSTRKKQK